jgi:hypothetical protein
MDRGIGFASTRTFGVVRFVRLAYVVCLRKFQPPRGVWCFDVELFEGALRHEFEHQPLIPDISPERKKIKEAH